MKPRVIFCSADEISIPCLEFLRTEPSITFCGIVTQPQRAKGRGQTLSLNPIAEWAQVNNLPFYQAETMNDAAFDWLKQMQPHLVLVMAFGHILKKKCGNLTHIRIIIKKEQHEKDGTDPTACI